MSIYKGTDFVAGTPDMSAYMTTNALLEAIYPVGSIYIGTQATCPLAALISGSTWTLVATDRALWGGDGTNANTTVAAGLPNITGQVGVVSTATNLWKTNMTTGGAFYPITVLSGTQWYAQAVNNTNADTNDAGFDASRSSSIYGQSNTVQPPAYVVNIWRRTA